MLTKEVSELLASLGDKVEARTKVLQLGLPDNIRKKIRLSERELKLALSRGAAMVQTFYPEHVIARSVEQILIRTDKANPCLHQDEGWGVRVLVWPGTEAR